MHRALRKRGIRVGKKRIARLMRENRIVARQKRRFRRTTNSNHTNPIAPNLLARDFEPAAPNHAWAGDVTYIATGDGWAYLAVLLELFSRRVVGWAMSATNDTDLALAALDQAVSNRHFLPAGLVHHTDRGSPYASDEYRRALSSHAMVASMSRTGDCWDSESKASSPPCAPSSSTTSATRLVELPKPRSATTSTASTTRSDCIRISTTSVRSSSN